MTSGHALAFGGGDRPRESPAVVPRGADPLAVPGDPHRRAAGSGAAAGIFAAGSGAFAAVGVAVGRAAAGVGVSARMCESGAEGARTTPVAQRRRGAGDRRLGGGRNLTDG